MSTRLEHGARLQPGTDLFDFLTSLRTVMDPVRDRLDLNVIAAAATHCHDDIYTSFEPHEDTGSWVTTGYRALQRQQITNQNHWPFTRHDFTAFFFQDPATEQIYASPVCEEAGYLQAWEAMEEVIPFGFRESCSPPANVSAQQWAERATIWGRLIPGYSSLEEHGLVFHLRPAHDLRTSKLTTWECVEPYAPQIRVPSRRARANRLLYKHLTTRLEREGITGPDLDRGFHTIHQLLCRPHPTFRQALTHIADALPELTAQQLWDSPTIAAPQPALAETWEAAVNDCYAVVKSIAASSPGSHSPTEAS